MIQGTAEAIESCLKVVEARMKKAAYSSSNPTVYLAAVAAVLKRTKLQEKLLLWPYWKKVPTGDFQEALVTARAHRRHPVNSLY